jgi:hypothetical protein
MPKVKIKNGDDESRHQERDSQEDEDCAHQGSDRIWTEPGYRFVVHVFTPQQGFL